MVNVAVKEETKFKFFRCFVEQDVTNSIIEIYEELSSNEEYGFVPSISSIANAMMDTFIQETIMRQVAYGDIIGPIPSQKELIRILEEDDDKGESEGYDSIYQIALEAIDYSGTFGNAEYHEGSDYGDSVMQMEFISDIIFVLEKNYLCYTKPSPLEGVLLGNIAEREKGDFVEVANNPLQEVW